MAPSKTLKNISLVVPGHSKRLSNLRTKSIKALRPVVISNRHFINKFNICRWW